MVSWGVSMIYLNLEICERLIHVLSLWSLNRISFIFHVPPLNRHALEWINLLFHFIINHLHLFKNLSSWYGYPNSWHHESSYSSLLSWFEIFITKNTASLSVHVYCLHQCFLRETSGLIQVSTSIVNSQHPQFDRRSWIVNFVSINFWFLPDFSINTSLNISSWTWILRRICFNNERHDRSLLYLLCNSAVTKCK